MSDPVTPIAMIGLSALGSANSISQASQQKKLSAAKTRLDLARAKRDEAEELGRGLARQNVVASTRGVATSTGSALQQAFAASRQSARNVGRVRANTSASNAEAALKARRATTGSLLSFAGDLTTQGKSLFG